MSIQEALTTLSGYITLIHNMGVLTREEYDELFSAETAIYDFVDEIMEE